MENVVRVDVPGAATYDTWTGDGIQYAYGDMWLSYGSMILNYALGFPLAAAAWRAVPVIGDRGSDPNLVLVGQTDCTDSTGRLVEYWLRKPDRATPTDGYTVFEHQTVHYLAGSTDGISPRLYCTDPNPDSSCNDLEDWINPGSNTVAATSIQTFFYGLKGQRHYPVRKVLRRTGDFTYVPTDTPNIIVLRPFVEPLINGWPAPYIGYGCDGKGWPPQ